MAWSVRESPGGARARWAWRGSLVLARLVAVGSARDRYAGCGSQGWARPGLERQCFAWMGPRGESERCRTRPGVAVKASRIVAGRRKAWRGTAVLVRRAEPGGSGSSGQSGNGRARNAGLVSARSGWAVEALWRWSCHARNGRAVADGLVLSRPRFEGRGGAVKDRQGVLVDARCGPARKGPAVGDRRNAASHGWAAHGVAGQSWSCAAGPRAEGPRLAWSGASWSGSPGRVFRGMSS